jgi:hypothetical protein
MYLADHNGESEIFTPKMSSKVVPWYQMKSEVMLADMYWAIYHSAVQDINLHVGLLDLSDAERQSQVIVELFTCSTS